MNKETIPLFLGGSILLLGIINAFVILEATGKASAKAETSNRLKTIHRTIAWIFILVFLVLAAGMHTRLKYWLGEPPSRVMFHWVLSLVVIASFTAKLVISRRYKKLAANLPVLGWTIMLSTFVLLTISGGFNMLRLGGAENLDPGSGYTHALVENKCSHCHTLERVYKLQKDKGLIEATVARMRGYSPDWISDPEAEAITEHLGEVMERKGTGETP